MKTPENSLPLAVITGGHSFDVPNFHRLFRRIPGFDAYIQPLDDFAAAPQETRDAYAAVLFYFMPRPDPKNEGLPWYAGKPQAALERLRTTGQGIVVLHHAILAYPDWPFWRELSGVDPTLESYAHDQTLQVRVTSPDHPITAGLSDFELVDETYQMGDADPGSQVLLTTEHPQSLNSLAWARTFGRSRVFCLALGHDNAAWSNPAFEQVLSRGLAWTVQ